MSFAAENGVGIQQRSIGDVLERLFSRKDLVFHSKHVLESGTLTTQGNNYIYFRRQMYINKFQFVLPLEYHRPVHYAATITRNID